MSRYYMFIMAMILFLIAVQSQESKPTNETELREIDVILYAFEVNSSTKVPFGLTASEDAKEERYNLTIFNNGDMPLNGVRVTADMGKGIKFINSIYSGYGRGIANAIIDPENFNETVRTKVKWDIGILQSGETKSILFRAYLKKNVDSSDIKVNVTSSDLGENKVDASVKEATIIKECPYALPDGTPCKGSIFGGADCERRCADWITQII